MKELFLSLLFIITCFALRAQPDRWQQKIKYSIDADMDVVSNKLNGKESIEYWNNSPDTLNKMFIHLYWNAFQPGSMMAVRSRELGKILLGVDKKGENVYDWDTRVRNRIDSLAPNEIGYQKVAYVKVNGVEQQLKTHETILEVTLSKPILPHTQAHLDIAFEAQVPLQIRRSGRDNAEGIRYSMSQWYPKVVEYDYQGWNANPYIAREFYGVWGDYDVNITIDKNYMLAGTGTIQNPNTVGFGYQAENVKSLPVKGSTLTWQFKAQNVHDFVWAADPEYVLIKRQAAAGPLLYIVYKKKDEDTKQKWEKMADTVALAYPFIAKTFGPYPYKNYSFIQGGDGGMEYPMATLIKNAGVGTAFHEWMHSWFQGMFGSNESLYPWMDEGGATYGESTITGWLHQKDFPYEESYKSYLKLVKSGREEPLSTHADHFNTNFAYSFASYAKGCLFYDQLSYIIGNDNMHKFLMEYYREWRFKHPNPNDLIRVAEKVSGLTLQWYKEYWVYTTKTIDYALGNISQDDRGNAVLSLKRVGDMPMPIDVLVTYKDGKKEMYNIPTNMMYGAKPSENSAAYIVKNEWYWTSPEYTFTISRSVADIKEVEIDPSHRMADINRGNNKLTIPNN